MEAGGLISPFTDFSPMSTYLFKYTEKKKLLKLILIEMEVIYSSNACKNIVVILLLLLLLLYMHTHTKF